MLKNCWECVMGSRINNEVYGPVLNGQPLTSAWPESHRQNEIMYRIPKPLEVGEIIEINGILQSTQERLLLNLSTGLNSPDNQEIACQVEADFLNNYFYTRGYVRGVINNEESLAMNVLGQFPADGRFSFTIEVRDRRNLDINLFDSYINTRVLAHSLEDITFLTIEGGVKVEELKFKYP